MGEQKKYKGIYHESFNKCTGNAEMQGSQKSLWDTIYLGNNKISAQPAAPWYNNDIVSQKMLRRKLEGVRN